MNNSCQSASTFFGGAILFISIGFTLIGSLILASALTYKLTYGKQ